MGKGLRDRKAYGPEDENMVLDVRGILQGVHQLGLPGSISWSASDRIEVPRNGGHHGQSG
jgi:hypothetical protein